MQRWGFLYIHNWWDRYGSGSIKHVPMLAFGMSVSWTKLTCLMVVSSKYWAGKSKKYAWYIGVLMQHRYEMILVKRGRKPALQPATISQPIPAAQRQQFRISGPKRSTRLPKPVRSANPAAKRRKVSVHQLQPQLPAVLIVRLFNHQTQRFRKPSQRHQQLKRQSVRQLLQMSQRRRLQRLTIRWLMDLTKPLVCSRKMATNTWPHQPVMAAGRLTYGLAAVQGRIRMSRI